MSGKIEVGPPVCSCMKVPALRAATITLAMATAGCQAPESPTARTDSLIGTWSERGTLMEHAIWTLAEGGRATHTSFTRVPRGAETAFDAEERVEGIESCSWLHEDEILQVDCPSDAFRARVRQEGDHLAMAPLERDEVAVDRSEPEPGMGELIASYSGTIERRRPPQLWDDETPPDRFVAQSMHVSVYSNFVIRRALTHHSVGGSTLTLQSSGPCALADDGRLGCDTGGLLFGYLDPESVFQVPFDEDTGEARFAGMTFADLGWDRER